MSEDRTVRQPAPRRHRPLTPEMRSIWIRAVALSVAGLLLALVPRGGRLRKLAAAVVGVLGAIGLFFAVAESTAPPATLRRKVRPLRDMVSLLLR